MNNAENFDIQSECDSVLVIYGNAILIMSLFK